jgi:hypothetical protein
MEIKLTLDELRAIIDASREKEQRQQRFAAAIQGIDIDKDKDDSAVDRVKQRVAAKLQKKSQEQVRMESVGLDYEAG